MRLDFSEEERFLVIRITGEIDHRYAMQIRNESDKRIVTTPDKRFILDLSGVTFMDSSGIGVIIGRYKLIKSFGSEIVIVSSNQTVGRILDMSGIQKIIPIYSSLEEAKTEEEK